MEKNKFIYIYILIVIVGFLFPANTQAQNWEQMENDYKNLLNESKNDLALNKAKELNLFALRNEGDTSLKYAVSLRYIGNCFSEININDSTIFYWEKSINILKIQNRYFSMETAYCLHNAGILFYEIGNYQAAIDHYLNLLKIYKQIIGAERQEYCDALSDIGAFYRIIGNYKNAEYYLKQSLIIRKKILGEKHLDNESSLINLSNLYADIDDYKTALDYCLKSIEIIKINLGEQNEDYSVSLNNLAGIYFELGDYKSAEKSYNKASELIKKIKGDYTEDYARCIGNLGVLYKSMGDFTSAEKNLSLSLEIYKKILGEHHYLYARNLANLGDLFLDFEDYSSAEKFYKMAMETFKESLGENHPEFADYLDYLGDLYLVLEDFKLSEQFYNQALATRIKTLGQGHSEIAVSLNNLGLLYLKLGNFYSAEIYFNQAADLNKIIYGESHPNYAVNLYNIGRIYYLMGDYNKAYLNFKQSADIQKRNYGDHHPKFAASLISLGWYEFEMKNFKTAKQHFNEALKIYKKNYGNENSEYALSLENLGVLYHEIGDYKKAKIYYINALFIRKKIINEDHSDYANSLINIGQLYVDIGRNNLGEPYFNKLLEINNKLLIKNFSWLTAKEKVAYWETQKNIYSNLNEFGIKSSIEYPSFTTYSYKANLIKKCLLLENSRELDKAIAESKDDSLISPFNEMKTLRRLYSKMQSEGSDKKEIMEKYNKQADSLDKILVNKVGEYSALKCNFKLTWQDVQDGITSNEAAIELVEYYDHKDSSNYYVALLVKKGSKYPEVVKLCKDEELKEYSPESELNDIYDLVWKPLNPYLEGIKTVYYSPSGLLNNIPFQALYKEVNGQREYVMDKFTLHQLTSTRYLALGLKQKEQESIESSIALFGGINYNDYPNAVIDSTKIDESSEAAFLYKNAITLNRDLDSTRAGASYLPGTKTEVNTIAQLLKNNNWNVYMAEGKNASENIIKSYSGNNSKSILHIATHGFAYPDKEEKKQDMALRMMQGNERYRVADNPMIRSGLLFGGANLTWQGKGDSLLNTTNEDGVLTAYELSQLDLSKTKLAVLSACETGKGAIQGSEGTFGLKRALKLAGVDNMIVSLWKVPDDATMEMMTLFYNELAKTKKPVSSFETAQKAMRLNYPNEPKKWAGFVFVR